MSDVMKNWVVTVSRKSKSPGDSYPNSTDELSIALTEAERNSVVSAILKTLAAVE